MIHTHPGRNNLDTHTFLLLLPYYNRPNMVRNALISVVRAGARHPQWKLAFIDDGSTTPGRSIVEELLGDQPEKLHYYYTGDDVATKIKKGSSRHGAFMNKAIKEIEADVCLMLCDDDALHGDYLYNLNVWFSANRDKDHCYSHVWIYNPYVTDPWSVPFTETGLNRFTTPINCACNVDASQVAWRRKLHFDHNIWFAEASTSSLDSDFYEKLNKHAGLTSFSGFIGQYKGQHASQLGKRPPTTEGFWTTHIDIPNKGRPT